MEHTCDKDWDSCKECLKWEQRNWANGIYK